MKLSHPGFRYLFNQTAAIACFVAAACAGSGSYVWIDDVPDVVLQTSPAVLVSVGDSISVKVFGQESLSIRQTVRSDGLVSIPLIGQVRAAGRAPVDISGEIEKRLEPFVNTPHATVVIEESHIQIVMAGEIRKPGTLDLSGATDLLTAIANAGGLTEFASPSSIYVLRHSPNGLMRIRFRWEDVSRGVAKASLFQLHNDDEVVVE